MKLQLSIFFQICPIRRTFLGDSNPQQLPPRRLQTLWEWKNRVLLEEYYIFNVVIPTLPSLPTLHTPLGLPTYLSTLRALPTPPAPVDRRLVFLDDSTMITRKLPGNTRNY